MEKTEDEYSRGGTLVGVVTPDDASAVEQVEQDVYPMATEPTN